jgi:hypothetical protein
MWGKRRWQIEGWFKTAKHRFGFHRFGELALPEGLPPQGTANPKGQGTLLGAYRWLVLSFLTFILAHWAYLSTNSYDLADWGQAARTADECMFPQIGVDLAKLSWGAR